MTICAEYKDSLRQLQSYQSSTRITWSVINYLSNREVAPSVVRSTAAALQSYRSYNVSDMALLVQQMKQLH